MNLDGQILQSRYIQTSQIILSNFLKTQRITIPKLITIKKNLKDIRKQKDNFYLQFQQFRQSIANDMNKAMGKIISIFYKVNQQKIQLEDQLIKTKQSQNKMKNQVIQLREMIDQFLKGYNKEIDIKDKQIQYLKNILNQNGIIDHLSNLQIATTISQQSNTQKIIQLDPILQQSENSISNSASNIGTKRQEKLSQSYQSSQSNRSISLNHQNNTKKTKVFLDDFRKNIQESSFVPNISSKNISINNGENNFKNINNNNISNDNNNKNKNFCNSNKLSLDQLTDDKQLQISKSSSSSDLIVLGDTDKINLPLKCQSPKNLMFVKKKSKRIFTEQNRLHTQQSDRSKQNSQLTLYQNYSRISTRPTIMRNSISESNQSRKNISHSKQKIQITSKIIQEMNNYCPKKKTHKHSGSVHLGSKNFINKFKTTIKKYLDQYKIWNGKKQQQSKYQGQKNNKKKQGYGKLYYKNGMIYSGYFYGDQKHGKGKITLGSKLICQGQWNMGQLNGYADIRSLSAMAEICPSGLVDASYQGHFLNNKFHGTGTLHLNKKQKIVTKFNQGTPIGQFTLYNSNNVDFGYWPQ